MERTLEITDKYNPVDAAHNQTNTFDRIEEEIDYSEFFHKYLINNTPCLLSSDFTRSWPARHLWTSSNNQPDLEKIVSILVEDYTVPVSDCLTRE